MAAPSIFSKFSNPPSVPLIALMRTVTSPQDCALGDRVRRTYYEMHTNQTMDFVKVRQRLLFFFVTVYIVIADLLIQVI